MSITRAQLKQFVKMQIDSLKEQGIKPPTEQEIVQQLVDEGYEIEDEFAFDLESVKGFAGNIVPSGTQAVLDTLGVFTPSGLSGLANLGVGTAQLGLSSLTGGDALLGFGDKRQYPKAFGSAMADRYGGLDEVRRTAFYDPVALVADASSVVAGGLGGARLATGAAGKTGLASKLGTFERLAEMGDVGGTFMKGAGKLGSLMGEFVPVVGGKAKKRRKKPLSKEYLAREQYYKDLLGDPDFELPAHMLTETHEPDVASAMNAVYVAGGETGLHVEAAKISEAFNQEADQIVNSMHGTVMKEDLDGNILYPASAGEAIDQGVIKYQDKFAEAQNKAYAPLGDLTLHQGNFDAAESVIRKKMGVEPEARRLDSPPPEVEAFLNETPVKSIMEAQKKAEPIVLSQSENVPYQPPDPEYYKNVQAVLDAPPSEIIRLYHEALATGDVKMQEVIATEGLRRIERMEASGIETSQQAADRALRIDKETKSEQDRLLSQSEDIDTRLRGEMEADQAFYRNYAEKFYPMQDANDKRFRYIELTQAYGEAPKKPLPPKGESKGPVEVWLAKENLKGYDPSVQGRRWKLNQREIDSLLRDDRIEWVDGRPMAIRYFEDDVPWLKQERGSEFVESRQQGMRQRQGQIAEDVESSFRDSIGQIEELSAVSEQALQKLDKTQNILKDLRSRLVDTKSLSQVQLEGKQAVSGAGQGVGKAVAALGGDDFVINLESIKQIRSQIRRRRDFHWGLGEANKFETTRNYNVGEMLNELYQALTVDYHDGAEMAADKLVQKDPRLSNALRGLRAINKEYREGVQKVSGEWVAWTKNWSANMEPNTIFEDIVLKGGQRRAANRRAVVPDEKLPEMMEVIGPEKARTVRGATLSAILDSAKSQEGYFNFGALDKKIKEIGEYRLQKLFQDDAQAYQRFLDFKKDVERYGDRVASAVGKRGQRVSFKDLVDETPRGGGEALKKLFNLQLETTAWKTIIGVPAGTVYNLKVSLRNALALRAMIGAKDFTMVRNAGIRKKYIDPDYPTSKQVESLFERFGSKLWETSKSGVIPAGRIGSRFRRDQPRIEREQEEALQKILQGGLEL